ncbi:hypothetical protein [Myroides profundi]|uniref:Transmembrane protein n=1 Tax=Myroides profundi TaxID=480520 RepID=A0AAJ5BE64_MYRPR|nr:hypothetical protein [Myroides profundi]AJH13712.1 membrane protein [Myroides profundi]SEQ98111.1 hypothetical protein SAMN04488089_10813 [Myroides profundi]
MKKTAKLFSYIFHPITVPFLTTLLYFSLAHFYFSSVEMSIILGQVLITTCLLPICIYFLLRSLKLVNTSVMVSSRKERIIPFIINIVLLFMLKDYILYNNSAYTIRLYIWGLMNSYLLLLLFGLLKQKSSVHITTLVTSFMFYIHVLIELQQPNIIGVILFVFLIGIVASSRLLLRAHTAKEIIQGFCIGIIPSLVYIFINYKI